MLQPANDIIFTELNDGEGVLLNLTTKLYYSLNATGAYMWRLIEEKKADNEAKLIESIQSRYQITLATAQSDVKEFLADLQSERLLLPPRDP